MADEHKSPVDKALDMLFFAPLGLALTARDELPNLVGKGRKQVESQVSMARMIGQFAAMQGRREAEKAAAKLVEQASGAAGRLGGLPGSPAPTRGAAAAARGAGEAVAAASPSVVVPEAAMAAPRGSAPLESNGSGVASNGSGIGSSGVGSSGVGSNSSGVGSNGSSHGAGSGARRTSPQRTALATADLAIPGYDTLSASHVVQRLGGLSRPELEAVREYEAANRGRRTILSKVAQLQHDAP